MITTDVDHHDEDDDNDGDVNDGGDENRFTLLLNLLMSCTRAFIDILSRTLGKLRELKSYKQTCTAQGTHQECI